jgi:hypothetical protein
MFAGIIKLKKKNPHEDTQTGDDATTTSESQGKYKQVIKICNSCGKTSNQIQYYIDAHFNNSSTTQLVTSKKGYRFQLAGIPGQHSHGC